MNAWISDEQQRIDVSVIDLEENTVTGTNHNYGPWVNSNSESKRGFRKK